MSGGREAAAEAVQWLQEAREELGAARRLLDAEDVAPRIACFHAHLAAEKALKALLVSADVRFPRTHDLVALEGLIQLSMRVFDPDDLDVLNPWSMQGRYPADIGEVSAEATTTVVTAAERVVQAVAGALGP